MNNNSETRRRFLKAGLAIPILSQFAWKKSQASSTFLDNFQVPDNIHHDLLNMFGENANFIIKTDYLQLKTPAIAENSAVVPITISGERAWVSYFALFVAQNKKPLASTCTLVDGSDLAVSLRIKVDRTSDVYLVAQTKNGLVGVKRNVKVTIGCGGG